MRLTEQEEMWREVLTNWHEFDSELKWIAGCGLLLPILIDVLRIVASIGDLMSRR